MADIIRTETHVQSRTIRSGEVTEGTSSIEVWTTVRSIVGRTDASVVRDFARALDDAGAPGNARIKARDNVGRLVELVAEWTEHVDTPDPPAS